MKLDLLTNATVVDDAIRFISNNKSNEKQKTSVSSNEDGKEELREHDYDEADLQIEEEREEQSRGTPATTTNKIF